MEAASTNGRTYPEILRACERHVVWRVEKTRIERLGSDGELHECRPAAIRRSEAIRREPDCVWLAVGKDGWRAPRQWYRFRTEPKEPNN